MTPSDFKKLFLLRPDITFLNFGSFGSCPKEIFDEYQTIQRKFEWEPIQFMMKEGPALLKQSREALGHFIHCDADDVVFTPNPTHAVNIIAKSLVLKPGDEILTTDLEYGAIDKTWMYYAKQYGYTYKRQPIQLPIASNEDFIQQFFAGWSERTKVVSIGQITSSTGIKLPVEAICKRSKELGLITIVDGAHVPGQIDVNLRELQADFFTGAAHKWMLAPKGCSFLYVKKEFQNSLDPLVVSWGYDSATPSHSQFLDYHQFQGTRDFSAWLTIPKCIDFMERYDWKTVSAHCRKLAQDNVSRFSELLGTPPHAPVNDDFFVQMCSLPIRTNNPDALKQTLYEKYKIEIPVMAQRGEVYIRYSIQAYNGQDDLDKLYDALKEVV